MVWRGPADRGQRQRGPWAVQSADFRLGDSIRELSCGNFRSDFRVWDGGWPILLPTKGNRMSVVGGGAFPCFLSLPLRFD